MRNGHQRVQPWRVVAAFPTRNHGLRSTEPIGQCTLREASPGAQRADQFAAIVRLYR